MIVPPDEPQADGPAPDGRRADSPPSDSPLAGAVLDHAATEEPDLDARVRFLVDVFGFRVLRRGTHIATGGRIVMLADPRGMKLELIEVTVRRGQLEHVAYRVADVDTAHKALLDAGCTEESPPFDIPAAHARSSLLVEPAGHRLQLITYQPDSPDLT